MNEKIFKTMTLGGVIGIITGVVTIVAGISVGILSIVSGIRLLRDRKGLIF